MTTPVHLEVGTSKVFAGWIDVLGRSWAAFDAGVAKTTIYRSWGAKVGRIVDALQRGSERDVPIPDTGSLRGDRHEPGDVVRRTIISEVGPQLIAAFVATGDADVADVSRTYWRERFRAFESRHGRTVDRLQGGIAP